MATLQPPAGIGNISFWRDLLKGLYYACAGQILHLVSFVGASIFTEHPRIPNTWIEWLPYVQGIVYAASGYVLAKFGINNVGQIGRPDKPTVTVAKETVDNLVKAANDKPQGNS